MRQVSDEVQAVLLGFAAGVLLAAWFVSLSRDGQHVERARRFWLFILAITLHNLPEGLAVGVGLGDSTTDGIRLAIGIGLEMMFLDVILG